MNDALVVDNLGFAFPGAIVAKGISFSLKKGDALIIAGRSGCGKSSLLELCARLRLPQEGRVLWNGADTSEFTYDEMIAARQRMGYVFQKHALIHNFPLFENIALPLRYHSGLPDKEIRARVRRCMEEIGLFNVDGKFPNELSAAQSKCAALARALIMEPDMLFADEPTAGVDPFTQECIANAIRQVRQERGMTVLMISNDVQTIRHMECPVTVLEGGTFHDISGTPAGDVPQPAIIASFQELL